MQLEEIKNRWNEVLDLLLEKDRITWLAFFDARLVSFENNQLTLDFADSQKFANPHDFEAIERVFGFTPTIIER
ncbi:MAG: hypothetical protein RL310_491 [Actinomycetota bacterium]